jgi:hypothetical protein
MVSDLALVVWSATSARYSNTRAGAEPRRCGLPSSKDTRPPHPRWLNIMLRKTGTLRPSTMLRKTGTLVPSSVTENRNTSVTENRNAPLRKTGTGFCFWVVSDQESFSTLISPDRNASIAASGFPVQAELFCDVHGEALSSFLETIRSRRK